MNDLVFIIFGDRSKHAVVVMRCNLIPALTNRVDKISCLKGTVTYPARTPYQLWKLGRLGSDFNDKPFRAYDDGHFACVTTTEPNADSIEVPRPYFVVREGLQR